MVWAFQRNPDFCRIGKDSIQLLVVDLDTSASVEIHLGSDAWRRYSHWNGLGIFVYEEVDMIKLRWPWRKKVDVFKSDKITEETRITYQSPTGRKMEFTVLHRKPLGFYVVRVADEDKTVYGSYGYDSREEVVEMLLRVLSDLSLLVDSMTGSIIRTVNGEMESGTVLNSYGYVKRVK